MTLPVDRFSARDYWLDVNPELSITDIPLREPVATRPLAEAARFGESIRDRGFFVATDALDAGSCEPLAAALARLVAAGIPTPFLLVYDEAWQMFARAGAVLATVVGADFLVGGDLWVWHVAADPGGSGWGPHRDGNLGDGTLPDGRAGLVTVWIPLTEATSANGCMYVLPTDRDPAVPDALDSKQVARCDLPSVRALPARPGDVLGWNTRLLHWGGRSSADAGAPRMSMSIYCQRRDAPRYGDDFVPLDGPIPLHHRLGVISRALLTYEKTGLSGTTLPPEVASFAEEQRTRLAAWLAMTAQMNDAAGGDA